MTPDEAAPIVELIEARYLETKTFYREVLMESYVKVLLPFDQRLAMRVVRDRLDETREPPTGADLTRLLRQAQRQRESPRSDADKYKPQPGVDYANEKQAFRALVEGWRKGGAKLPLSEKRITEIEAKLREDLIPSEWMIAAIVDSVSNIAAMPNARVRQKAKEKAA